jgi:hypothetical protein
MSHLVFKETLGKSPASLYDLMEGDIRLGFIQIRHKPSHAPNVPPSFASHIYYEILPEFRGKGHGSEILKLGLLEAKRIITQKVIVTCREYNTASKRIIEKSGGVLVDTVPLSGPGGNFLKYEIPLCESADASVRHRMQESDIPKRIEGDAAMMTILRATASLGLPDWWIGAGFVRNKVWDVLSGLNRTPPGDIDVVYFDPNDLSEDRELEYQDRLEASCATGKWSVTNQARMHVENGDEPYTSSLDAIAHWPETATAVAITLDDAGHVVFCAPCGAGDLLQMIVRPTPAFEKKLDVFRARLEKKNWSMKWPKVRIEVPGTRI